MASSTKHHVKMQLEMKKNGDRLHLAASIMLQKDLPVMYEST